MHLDIMETIQSLENEMCKVEILQYKSLDGSTDPRSAEMLYHIQQVGMRLKQVKMTLKKNTKVTLEPGALHFMKGNLSIASKAEGGVARSVFRSMASGETVFQTTIEGTGEVYLEPSWGHFMLVEMDDSALICDKSTFYASSQDVEVSSTLQRNVSSALFGGEGYYQTRLSGTGICVLTCTVPEHELMQVDLSGDKLSVDGHFAVMRTDEVEFKAEKSAKTLLGSVTSGEGLLQTFSGHGTVWIAPTENPYKQLAAMIQASLYAASANKQ